MISRIKRSLRGRALWLAPVSGAALLGVPTVASAAVYITGSVSNSTTNVPLEKSTMQYGNAAVDIDLGRYIRFGINYGVEVSTTAGYQLPGSTSTAGTTQNVTCPTTTSCVPVVNTTRILDKGAGLTIILWAGDIFMPYVTVGAIMKTYTFNTQINGGAIDERKGSTPPEPDLGAGLSIRLNREFSMKIAIQASLGVVQVPGDVQGHQVWDKKETFGLSYQIN